MPSLAQAAGGMTGDATPQALCRCSSLLPDALGVHKHCTAILDHNAPVHDHRRDVATLSDVNERSNRVERGREMRAAKVEEHDVGLFATR